MSSQRVGGIIQLAVGGERFDCKGNFTYNLGYPKREPVNGADATHGFKEVPQPAFIEGEVTDRGGLSIKKLVTMDGATATLKLANGKVISLRSVWYAGEGTGNTEEGNIGVRFESKSRGTEHK